MCVCVCGGGGGGGGGGHSEESFLLVLCLPSVVMINLICKEGNLVLNIS